MADYNSMAVPYSTFRELVAKMRAAQRNYFATRSMDSLKEAKTLEIKVDKLIESTNLRNLFAEAAEEEVV